MTKWTHYKEMSVVSKEVLILIEVGFDIDEVLITIGGLMLIGELMLIEGLIRG